MSVQGRLNEGRQHNFSITQLVHVQCAVQYRVAWALQCSTEQYVQSALLYSVACVLCSSLQTKQCMLQCSSLQHVMYAIMAQTRDARPTDVQS